MKAMLFAALLAALIVPAAAFSEDGAGQDRANAARACSALRTSMGLDLFRQTYGTAASNRRNAFGKCVSQWTHAEQKNRQSARAQCAAEQADPNFPASHDGETFAQFYGTGKGANAFGRCVSGKAKLASAKARQDTLNAARLRTIATPSASAFLRSPRRSTASTSRGAPQRPAPLRRGGPLGSKLTQMRQAAGVALAQLWCMAATSIPSRLEIEERTMPLSLPGIAWHLPQDPRTCGSRPSRNLPHSGQAS
jgi:hypothetical protein